MVVKTGVSLPDEVYNELSRIARLMGYGSISKAVRDAVEMFIAFNRWWTARGRVFGTIQVLASLERPTAEDKLLETVRSHDNVVKGLLRIPVAERYSLHLLIVEGDSESIKTLYKNLVRIDGILAVQASLLPGGPEQREG